MSFTAVPHLDDEQIKQLAVDVVDGRVFLANNPEAVKNAWMVPLAFITDPLPKECAAFFEDMSRAGPRSINGYPTFFSFKMLHNEDLDPVLKAMEDYKAVKEGFVSEAKEATQ